MSHFWCPVAYPIAHPDSGMSAHRRDALGSRREWCERGRAISWDQCSSPRPLEAPIRQLAAGPEHRSGPEECPKLSRYDFGLAAVVGSGVTDTSKFDRGTLREQFRENVN